MALIGKFLLVGILGALLGLGVTVAALRGGVGFGAVRAGPWTAWPRAGDANIDPYLRAQLTRSGEIPLGVSEGVSFVAKNDSAGGPLNGACDYAVSGQTPQARYWTLTAMTPRGRLAANPAARTASPRAKSCAGPMAAFPIALIANARPGNWLLAPLCSDKATTICCRCMRPNRARRARLRIGETCGHRQGLLPMSGLDRFLAGLLWCLAILCVAGIVHILAVFNLPKFERNGPFARISALTRTGGLTLLPRAGPAPNGRPSPIPLWRRARACSISATVRCV